MTDKDFLPIKDLTDKTKTFPVGWKGKTAWKSPSNIALVKYWGKRKGQIPANPSLSFTLSQSTTTTVLEYEKLKFPKKNFSFDILLDGSREESFRPKIETFFNRVEAYLPFLKDFHFRIGTSNSFPHSSGIASSASGMSALALCLMDLENIMATDVSEAYFNRKASFLARLGSGSACRSIEGNLMEWGYHKEISGSSDFYGIRFPGSVHNVFENYCDTILLVDQGQKQVSSTVGHDLMQGHPFAKERFEQAYRNLADLSNVLKTGDLNRFIEIVESEALTLHAMMMASRPYFILMKPKTLEIITEIWQFRATSKSSICFTLDAGANVHVLYPQNEKEFVRGFIKDRLIQYCENGMYIDDETGRGAERL